MLEPDLPDPGGQHGWLRQHKIHQVIGYFLAYLTLYLACPFLAFLGTGLIRFQIFLTFHYIILNVTGIHFLERLNGCLRGVRTGLLHLAANRRGDVPQQDSLGEAPVEVRVAHFLKHPFPSAGSQSLVTCDVSLRAVGLVLQFLEDKCLQIIIHVRIFHARQAIPHFQSEEMQDASATGVLLVLQLQLRLWSRAQERQGGGR